MNKRKRNVMQSKVGVPAEALYHLIRATEEWLAERETVLAHVRRTGKYSCEEGAEPADAAVALRMVALMRDVEDASDAARAAFPPAVWRHVEDVLTTCDHPDHQADRAEEDDDTPPLSGQAAKDLDELMEDL